MTRNLTIISALLLALLIAWSVSSTMSMWSKEYHLRARNTLRFQAYRALAEGKIESSQQLFREALRESKLSGDSGKPSWIVASSANDLADCLIAGGRPEKARRLYADALDLASGESIEDRQQLARAYVGLSVVESANQKGTEARDHLSRAVDLLASVEGYSRSQALSEVESIDSILSPNLFGGDQSSSAAIDWSIELQRVWPDAIGFQWAEKENRSATRWQDALAILVRREQALARGNPVRLVALGRSLVEMSRHDQAAELIAGLIAEKPELSSAQWVDALDALALSRLADDDIDGAREAIAKAVGLARRELSSGDAAFIELHEAQILSRTKEAAKGVVICKEILRAGAIPENDRWYIYRVQGQCYLKTRRPQEALASFSNSMQLLKNSPAYSTMDAVSVHQLAAQALLAMGQTDQARSELQIAFKAQYGQPGEKARPLHQCIARLARRCMRAHQYRLAATLYEWLIEVRSKLRPPMNRARLARTYRYLAEAYKKSGQFDLAREVLERRFER